MPTRIGTRMIIGVGLVTALSIGLMAVLIIGTHERQLVAERKRAATRLSDTIKSSTHHDMLENRREALHRQIETIGRQEGIERVRVFNKEGRIMFSSDANEIGHAVDKQGEACYACHSAGRPLEKLSLPARSRVFRGPDDHRILGIINPIENETGCSTASCHAHSPDQSVLGVLDVTVSLEREDRQIAQSRARMAGLAALTILACSAILFWLTRRLVVRPVQALAAGTQAVAEGDLTRRIEATGDHELGDLGRAFNTMTGKLAEAQHQITQAEKLASVGRLAAGVAHEINNPLTGVLTYSSLLLKRTDGPPELRSDLETIVRETKRCREIVKGLLDFSRQNPPQRKPADINEAVRRAVAVVMNQLRVERVALTLDLAPDLPLLPADADQIQQVVVNLMLNAVDAIGSSGGKVRVTTCRRDLPPLGNAEIRRAACPEGCDLLDTQVRIRGLPAIQAIRKRTACDAVVHLDPVYGRFNHLVSDQSEQQIESAFLCPKCRASLDVKNARCPTCGAGVFTVAVSGEGRVEWCRRLSCHWSRWDIRDAAGPQPTLEIELQDSGCGIPAEALPHIFEPFFSTKGAHGTGLGLAVSWGIVDSHGGRIDVESAVGRGSCFTVRLPGK
jgi:two-component system NtrC family sensor kinase